jgi:hypothetical protein
MSHGFPVNDISSWIVTLASKISDFCAKKIHGLPFPTSHCSQLSALADSTVFCTEKTTSHLDRFSMPCWLTCQDIALNIAQVSVSFFVIAVRVAPITASVRSDALRTSTSLRFTLLSHALLFLQAV